MGTSTPLSSTLRASSISSGSVHDFNHGSPRIALFPNPSAGLSVSHGPKSFAPTVTDKSTAEQLMQKERENQGKTHNKPYSFKESSPVLAEIVSGRMTRQHGVTPGVVEVLLSQYDASLSVAKRRSSSILKKVIGVNQTDTLHSTDLLTQAVQHCDAEIVKALLQHADMPSKARALPFAMQTNDPLKVQYVMSAGADASTLCEEFQKVVQSGSCEMMYALVAISKTRGPCQRCLDMALGQVVDRGCVQRARLLLQNGADVAFQGSAGLFAAIQNERADLVNVLLFTTSLANPKPRIPDEILDKAVHSAYRKLDRNVLVEAQYQILQSILAAGAKGNRTSRVLAEAVQSGHSSVLNMFVEQQVPVYDDKDAGMEIIKAAIATERPEIVKTVLAIGRGPSRYQMTNGITQALSLKAYPAGLVIAGILLDNGLRGDVASSEGLLSAVKLLVTWASQPNAAIEVHNRYYEMVQLFLDKGAANVDHQGGEVVLLAAGQGLVDVLGLLIQYQPSVDILSKAVLPAMRVFDIHKRYTTVKMLLQAGARGTPVAEALTQSAGMGKDHVNLTSMILPYSTVDFQGGRPLSSAVRSGCIEQISLLVEHGNPSHATIDAAWVEVQTVADEEFQMAAYSLFLRNGNVSQDLYDRGLVGAAALGHRGKQLCELMLKHGASPARLGGQALATAAKHFFFSTVQMLSAYVKSKEIYTNAFDALTEDPTWLMSDGLRVAELLLQKGAAGKVVESAFCQAARHHAMEAVILLQSHVGTEAFGIALISATSDPSKWPSTSDDALELITQLLEWGAGSEYVNEVFLTTVESGSASEDIIETLISVGDGHADVNFQNGEVMKIAIRQGNPVVLDQILKHSSQNGPLASKNSIIEAFAEAVTTDRLKDDNIILEILDVLIKPRHGASASDFRVPIFSCITAHPKSPRLVKRLAELGCDMMAETYVHLYDDEDVQAEPANALLWAVSLTDENQISSDTIAALIDINIDVNYTSPISGATPLILAAKYGRGDVVAKLVGSNAKVSVRDQFGRSALFYASRVGNVDAIKALVKAKVRVNDGSLQEAARMLHSEAVQLLVKAGHSPNYPSSDIHHDGRDSLQELAMMSRPSASQVIQLEDTIKSLVGGKDKDDKIELLRDPNTPGSKNALFLALDNQGDSCWLVCKALMDVVMWKFVNNDANVYCELDPEAGTKLFVSPTMYIRLGWSHGPEKQKDELLRLLYRMRCQDRFYGEYGREQPQDAVGLPDDIAKAELKRKENEQKLIQQEENHQRAIIRKEHEAEVQREMERLHHEEKLMHQREMEEQKRQQAEFSHMQKRMHAADSHEQKLEMQAQIAQSQQRWAVEKARFEETKKLRMNALSETKLQREQQLKLGFEKSMSAQKEARQRRQNILAQQAAKRKLEEQKKMQGLRSKGEKQRLEFKKKQNDQAKGMLRTQLANKRKGHDLQMEKVHADQQTLRMKAAMKYFDEKNRKRIGA